MALRVGCAALFTAATCGMAQAEPKSAAGTPAAEANTCLTCHRELPDARLRVVAEQFEASVHRDERIGCHACHGGAPTDPTVRAHDPNEGFVVRPPHERISEICGGCHEDPVFIRRFDAALPTDQKKLYTLSRHGKLANAGDARAPTCTDCHGVHDIDHVDSPSAPVHDTRVVELCARCHADRKHMAPFDLDTKQVEQWERSVHGRAVASGNDRAPTCKGCHSPHAGKLPGAAAVEALCDRCHADQRDLFMDSPHAKPFRRLGLGECVPCHGSHEVAHPTAFASMAPGSACSKCHAKSDEPRRTAETIGELLGGLDRKIDESAAALAVARNEGLSVPLATTALTKARSARFELSAKTHTLDVVRIREGVEGTVPMFDEVRTVIDRARRERIRERRGYVATLIAATVLFGLLVAKAVLLARRGSRPP